MYKRTDYFYELKEDIFLSPYNATAPAGSLAIVLSIQKKQWTFLLLPFLDNEPIVWDEEKFLTVFKTNKVL